MASRRLWMVNHYAVDGSSPGGTRHLEMGRILKGSGWDTTIFASSYDHQALSFHLPTSWKKPIDRTTVDGVDFVWVHTIPYDANNYKRYVNMLSFMVLVLFAMIATRPRPTVIMGSSPHLLAPIPARLMAAVFRVPFVLEIRDLWPESLVQLGLRNPIIVKPLALVERWLYRSSVEVFGLTNGIVRGVRAKAPASTPVTLVPNGVSNPEPVDQSARLARRSELGWDNDVVAIYAGAHGPANDLGVIIEAARLLKDRPDVRFVLIGDGPTKPALIEQAQGLENVTFLDSAPKAEAMRNVQAADIGLMVYKDVEAFKGARPNKLFDYMSAQIPLIVNMDGEARELLEEARAGLFVTPENSGELARAVEELANSPESRRQAGENGFAWLVQTHTREQSVAVLNERLNGLVQPGIDGRKRRD